MYSNNPHTTDDLKVAITEHTRNVDRAILNTVFENIVRRVNKCLETGGGHFEHYLFLYRNHQLHGDVFITLYNPQQHVRHSLQMDRIPKQTKPKIIRLTFCKKSVYHCL
jgi:predicted transcriptional regulator